MSRVELITDEDIPYFRIGKMRIPVQFEERSGVGLKTDLFARALGYKKTQEPMTALDLTAGLGRDSFHLVTLGYDVTAIERHPLICKALNHAMLQLPEELGFNIVNAEAKEFLEICDMFDVIYFDPMFPEKKKSAAPGKESQLLQALAIGDSVEDENEILELALKKARKRVIVKRPKPAHSIGAPSLVQSGKSIRYDVYFPLNSVIR